MDAMRLDKLVILITLLLSFAGTANAQMTGPSADDSVPTPIAANTASSGPGERQTSSETFSNDEIVQAAGIFFGGASGALGQAVERIFRDQGRPTGYIKGEEASGALALGVRYGRGTLVMKDGQERTVFWQGPSFGFDTGGNVSKVFTLVYNLDNPDGLYRRYPGVEGSAFFIAGVAVTYQRAEGVTLAPMRTGVGFRAGVNTGYTAYSKRRRWLPL